MRFMCITNTFMYIGVVASAIGRAIIEGTRETAASISDAETAAPWMDAYADLLIFTDRSNGGTLNAAIVSTVINKTCAPAMQCDDQCFDNLFTCDNSTSDL